MHITRLKRGYRIRLTDSEYSALVLLVNLGQADMESMNEFDWDDLKKDDPVKVRGLEKSFSDIPAMSIDEDSR